MGYIYCYGMINPSQVFLLEGEYPEANGYGEVHSVLDSVGGEAVNTAIMLSKLGIESKLDGTWLIQRGASVVRELLEPFSIDISRVKDTALEGPNEIVIADGESRTCFGNFDSYQKGPRKWGIPVKEDILGAEMVALDPFFPNESLTIARICADHKIPFVTLDAPYDELLAKEAAVIAVSKDFMEWNYPEMDREELFECYQLNCSGLVIFTFGSRDVWFGRRGQQRSVEPAFRIAPVDSTAAGDSYRAGIIYGLRNKMTDRELVRFANGVAACVCLSVPHTLNAPDLQGVKDFIKEHSPG